MGKLKLNLMFENQEASQSNNFMIGSIAQQLKIKYGLSKMEEIKFNGEDHLIEIDIETNENTIDWNHFDYPN